MKRVLFYCQHLIGVGHLTRSIALCEAYGLSKDNRVGPYAQRALAFIESAQNPTSGGWHYGPRAITAGDTSVVGWQMMALKSGQMAGLKVDPKVVEGGKKFFLGVARIYCAGFARGLNIPITADGYAIRCYGHDVSCRKFFNA